MANEYNEYLAKINEMLKDDPFYNEVIKGINKGENDFRIVQKINKKIFDIDWVDTIEDALVALDTIVRNPRKFIVIEEDIIDISLARSISVESVRHLAQHTNMIADVSDDQVTPSKILNTSKEESYEVYENRFIYTLLKKVSQFVNTRYDVISKAMADNDQVQILIESRYNVGFAQLQFKLDTIAKMSFDDAMSLNKDGLTPIERVARMRQIINGFMSSPFAKAMVGSAPVRPPITRTNVIKKNPNYKKALTLWQFIETYNKSGFEVESICNTTPLNSILTDEYKGIMFINNMILQNIAGKTIQKSEDWQDPLEKQKSELNIDDFPEINLELGEIKRTYVKSEKNESELISDKDYYNLTSAIDRVLQQEEINEAVHNREETERLMKEQKKNEEKALEAQRKFEEREREREEKARKEREREYERDLIRKAKEDEIAQLKMEHERTIEEQRKIERERLEELERKKVEKQLEMRRRREQELIAMGKRQAHLVQQYNINVLKSVEIMRLDELKRKYKLEMLKMVDQTFEAILRDTINNQEGYDEE